MCHLLTIGISGGAGDSAEIFRAHGLHIEPAVNPHVRAAMPSGAVPLDVTEGGCSCSIRPHSRSGGEFDEIAERRTYERKGWSVAKIARAIEAKRTAHARIQPNTSVHQFLVCVEALVRAGSRVSLISHFYSGRFADEVVAVDAKARMTLKDLRDQDGRFSDDTLVTVD